MGKFVLDITMPLDGFIVGSNDKFSSPHNRTCSGQAVDNFLLTDSSMRLVNEGSGATGIAIADFTSTVVSAHNTFPEYGQSFNNVYFCYQSEHIRLVIIRITESLSLIHLSFHTQDESVQ